MKPLTADQTYLLSQIPPHPVGIPSNDLRHIDGRAASYHETDMRVLRRRHLIYCQAKFNRVVSRTKHWTGVNYVSAR